MKTDISDPWCGTGVSNNDGPDNCFEDSFLDKDIECRRLSDSEQYLQKLCKTTYKRYKINDKKSFSPSMRRLLQSPTPAVDSRVTEDERRVERELFFLLLLNRVLDFIKPFYVISEICQIRLRSHTRLKVLQGGKTKKDLVTSLSAAKEDCIARLITSGNKPLSEEEAELVSNPLIRHIAPHLQALTASELVHLLKADQLQATTEAEQEQDISNELQTKQSSTELSREHKSEE